MYYHGCISAYFHLCSTFTLQHLRLGSSLNLTCYNYQKLSLFMIFSTFSWADCYKINCNQNKEIVTVWQLQLQNIVTCHFVKCNTHSLSLNCYNSKSDNLEVGMDLSFWSLIFWKIKVLRLNDYEQLRVESLFQEL